MDFNSIGERISSRICCKIYEIIEKCLNDTIAMKIENEVKRIIKDELKNINETER